MSNSNALNDAVKHCKNGTAAFPRGRRTMYVENYLFTYKPLHVSIRRGGVPAIGIAEGLQLIAGVFDKDHILKVAPKCDITLFGPMSSYGPRIVDQVESIIDELKKDKHSRRAVLRIAHESDKPSELPCTLSIAFSVKNDELTSNAVMRSTDVIWGLPYDILQFGMLTSAIANIVGLKTGSCTVYSHNMHIYTDINYAYVDFSDYGIIEMPKYDSLDSYKLWAATMVKEGYAKELINK